MRHIADCLPQIPKIDSRKTSSIWPVWTNSTTAKVRYAPLPKREAVKLFHQAREFERQTRKPGNQDGDLGRNGLLILHALLFDCLNYQTGRLDPSQKTIARKACISERSVTRGLAKLKAAGVLNWLKRAGKTRDEQGRFCLEQDTNAYAVLPVSQWIGFIDTKPTPPPVHPSEWGAMPPLPDLIAQAIAERRQGQPQTALAILATDPGDTIAAALARLGRTLDSQNRQ